MGVWAHGRATFLDPAAPEQQELENHLVLVYGQSPTGLGPDIVYVRIDAHWMVGFSMTPEELVTMQDAVRAREERLARLRSVTG